MAYGVVLRRNGAKVGYFGPFGTKKQAIAQGQVLADDSARDVVVSVEPQRKKTTTKRTNTRTTRKNWGAGSFAEKPVTLIFSTKEKANAFKKSLDKNEVSGKFSVRKTKGWNTYSLVFTPHSYSDVVAIRKYYRPEESYYKDIERDLRTNTRKNTARRGGWFYATPRTTRAEIETRLSEYTRPRLAELERQRDAQVARFPKRKQGEARRDYEIMYNKWAEEYRNLKDEERRLSAKRTNTRRTRKNPTDLLLNSHYLAQSIDPREAYLELLPSEALDRDSLSTDLTDRGFLYARFPNTKQLVLVLPKRNQRFLKTWNTYVTDFDVYEVKTGVKDGAIVTKLGKKHPRIKRLFANAKILGGPTRTNPSRGAFKSQVYSHYTVAGGKLTSGHGSRAAALKQANGKKANVKTDKQAEKMLGGRSLTSSSSWYNRSRSNPRENPTRSNPASKAILRRIDLANKWIAFAQKHDIRGIDTSSSWHSSLTYTHKIAVSAGKNRATVKYTEDFAPGKKQSETYNLSNTDTYSDTGVSALRYAINTYIIKPIKRGAKDDNVAIPASLR